MNASNRVNSFRTKAKGIKTKIKTSMVLFKNVNHLKRLSSLERFLSRFHVIIAPTFQDYVNGVSHPWKRMFAFLINVMDWLMVLRFAFLAYCNEPWIWILFGDSFYSWGWGRYVHAMLAILGTTVATVKSSYLVFGASNKLYVINYMDKIMRQRQASTLNWYYYSKYARWVLICSKILYPSLIACALVPILGHFCTSIICYLENEHDHSIIAMIVSNILIASWITHACAMGFGGAFILQFLSIMHLKYEFRQCNDKIQKSIKDQDYTNLISAIECHQNLAETVNKLNEFMKYVIGFCFFCCTPGMDILLFLVFKFDISLIIRLVYTITGLGLIAVQIAINYMCASFTATVYKQKNSLYENLNNRGLSMTSRSKIMAFIEKLNDFRIGFYCFDLFLCDNYEFYQYLSFFSSNYFLVHSFVDQFAAS